MTTFPSLPFSGSDLQTWGQAVDSAVSAIPNITSAEFDQIAKINSVTISNAQWGIVGNLDQNLRTTDGVTFANLTIGNITSSGNISVTGTVDGRDIATDGTKLDNIEANATEDQTGSEIATLLDTEIGSDIWRQGGGQVEEDATTSRTLTSSDVSKTIYFTSSSAVTVTLENNINQAIDTGEFIDIVQVGSGTVTVDPVASVSINGAADTAITIPAQFGGVRLQKYDTNLWTGKFFYPSFGAASQKGVTGADVNTVTGTAGTDGNLAEWNADGDLVDSGNSTSDFATSAQGTNADKFEFLVDVSNDESTALTTGTAKKTFRFPFDATITEVRAHVTTAPVGANLTVDVNNGGTSVFSTILSIDDGEKTSTTAATAAVISTSAVTDDDEFTIDIDQVGSSTAGAGLKLWFKGTR